MHVQVAGAVQAEYDVLVAEDKALEKSFRQRKELAEAEPFMDTLFKMYKRRAKKPNTGSGG
jgi:hypothetical protein